MAMSTTMKGGEEYLSLEQREAYYAMYVQTVNDMNDMNEGKLFPDMDPSDPPRSDAPSIKWRGHGLLYAKVSGPRLGYGIPHRARDIARSLGEGDPYYDYNYYVDEIKEKERVVWLKALLDELQAYDFESIDAAAVLHSFGCLSTLLRNAFSQKHACIRAKAAEVITSMVQNHPATSQQLLIEANALQLLLHNFTTDPDTTSRTKTLGAISSLIRNNKSGITVFLREKGYETVRNALISRTVLPRSSTYREVVNLIEYLRPGTLRVEPSHFSLHYSRQTEKRDDSDEVSSSSSSWI